jgi:hypothetical protein
MTDFPLSCGNIACKISSFMRKRNNKHRRNHRRSWLIRRDRINISKKSGAPSKAHRFIDPSKWLPLNDHTKKSVKGTNDNKFIIELPETLDFEENYESTASHFQMLRAAVKYHAKLRNLRFDKIKFISPSAALVLASEVDHWNQRAGGRLRAAVESWQEDIKRLLCQMGYFELLHLERPTSSDAVNKSTNFLQFKRGDQTNRNSGQLAKQLRIEIEKLVGFAIKKQFLFEGLSEAITNVGQHAYPDTNSIGFKQWWLSASYDKDDRRLCVMFYDQGVGIPATLPSSHLYEFMKKTFTSWADSQKIEAAMEVGRTSTRLQERGKGLQNLVEFAKIYSEGRLSIYSIRGMYKLVSVRNGTDSPIKTHRRDLETSIGGTLIEWSVKL